jgi:hypothetical protein
VRAVNEAEALAQFVTIEEKDKCGKCATRLVRKLPDNTSPDKYFDAPWGKPQVEVCVTCFDNDIKSRMF